MGMLGRVRGCGGRLRGGSRSGDVGGGPSNEVEPCSGAGDEAEAAFGVRGEGVADADEEFVLREEVV